jgi:hypothetical protein
MSNSLAQAYTIEIFEWVRQFYRFERRGRGNIYDNIFQTLVNRAWLAVEEHPRLRAMLLF